MDKRKVGLFALLVFVVVGTAGALKALRMVEKRLTQHYCPLARE